MAFVESKLPFVPKTFVVTVVHWLVDKLRFVVSSRQQVAPGKPLVTVIMRFEPWTMALSAKGRGFTTSAIGAVRTPMPAIP